MYDLSIDVSEVLKSPTVHVLLGAIAQVFLLLLPELPLAEVSLFYLLLLLMPLVLLVLCCCQCYCCY